MVRHWSYNKTFLDREGVLDKKLALKGQTDRKTFCDRQTRIEISLQAKQKQTNRQKIKKNIFLQISKLTRRSNYKTIQKKLVVIKNPLFIFCIS